ncbi:hypothetical protein BSKO_06697 [Bryopsis sp. KO-2023]|nr:hypothetical protein BSKO_06697 [Bryopsis sp. KO-2023]
MGSGDRRLRWTSRYAFLLAAIGSAVGLGNIWRFPWLSFKYGGGIFLVPYLLALLFVGLPMLMVELGVGRAMQRGDVEAFGKIHRRCRGVGISSILGGFLITAFYVNIISWSLVYFVASFEWPLPWDGREKEFLYEDVLHSASKQQIDEGKSYVIAGWVYGGLVFIWAFMYIVLAFGVKGVGTVVKFTVPFPVLLIGVMLIYNATLEGAKDGVDAYIGEWDTSGLKGGVWPAAVGQIFFSNSIALGVMTAYGSYNAESSNIVMDNAVIAFSNSAISFIAGFTVYTVLGNMAHKEEKSVAEAGNVSGVTLAFITYPSATASFPDGASRAMSIFFFFTLFTLGIDSALSLIEGAVTVLKDTIRFRHVPRAELAGYTCVAGFLLSTLYATDLGESLLDICDHYINTYGVMITGLAEAVTVSWIYGYEDTIRRVGKLSADFFTYGFLVAVFVGVALSGALYDPIEDNGYLAVGIPVGFLIWVVSVAIAFAVREDESMSIQEWLKSVVTAGPEKLRKLINDAAIRYGNWRLPIVWDLVVKYIIPPTLLGLLVNAAIADAVNKDASFYKYPAWEHILGIAILVLMLTALFGSAIFPSFWEKGFGAETQEEDVKVKEIDLPTGSKTATV